MVGGGWDKSHLRTRIARLVPSMRRLTHLSLVSSLFSLLSPLLSLSLLQVADTGQPKWPRRERQKVVCKCERVWKRQFPYEGSSRSQEDPDGEEGILAKSLQETEGEDERGHQQSHGELGGLI